MAFYLTDGSDCSICIVKAERLESYTDYTIEIRVSSFHWTVNHRYSDFFELHEQLVKEYGLDKKLLPPKKAFGNNSEMFIQKRRSGLERYLQFLFKYFEKLPFQLALFLEFQKYEVNGITQVLAETLFERGESLLAKDSVCSMDPLQLHSVNQRMSKPESVVGTRKRDIGHVLDFITRLKRLRVIGADKNLGTSNINMNNLEFGLSVFKNITYLELVKCNVSKIHGLDKIRKTLKKLKIKKSLVSIQEFLTQDVLYWESEDGHSSELPIEWPQLKWVDFSENQIALLPETLKYLEKVEYLDLHDNYLESFDNLQLLSYLSQLDASSNRIKHLSDLHLRLGNVKSLSLAGNSLETLNGFGRLYSLEYLDISNNQISQVIELHYIGDLPLLETLIVIGNPLTVIPDYRVQVLKLFGDRAREVALDNKKANEKELDTIAVLLALDHAKNPESQRKRTNLTYVRGCLSLNTYQNSDRGEHSQSSGQAAEAVQSTSEKDIQSNQQTNSQTIPHSSRHRFDSPFNSSSFDSEVSYHSVENTTDNDNSLLQNDEQDEDTSILVDSDEREIVNLASETDNSENEAKDAYRNRNIETESSSSCSVFSIESSESTKPLHSSTSDTLVSDSTARGDDCDDDQLLARDNEYQDSTPHATNQILEHDIMSETPGELIQSKAAGDVRNLNVTNNVLKEDGKHVSDSATEKNIPGHNAMVQDPSDQT